MPCTLPEGEESGVFMSPCASSQMKPMRFDFLLKWAAAPAVVPTAMEWSPPRTSGTNPSSRVFPTISARPWQVSAISSRYFALFLAVGLLFRLA